ncbi:MAG: hypothetical protein HOW73_19760 [Polyangiaceae bacterium]|nr:hypothetical protein [Polyangiaceae bacterium]
MRWRPGGIARRTGIVALTAVLLVGIEIATVALKNIKIATGQTAVTRGATEAAIGAFTTKSLLRFPHILGHLIIFIDVSLIIFVNRGVVDDTADESDTPNKSSEHCKESFHCLHPFENPLPRLVLAKQ